ncbi:MAG TPA: hypothetical protein VGE83_09600 [Terracidiphilus sp.]|jgi:hypothetical protein
MLCCLELLSSLQPAIDPVGNRLGDAQRAVRALVHLLRTIDSQDAGLFTELTPYEVGRQAPKIGELGRREVLFQVVGFGCGFGARITAARC